MRRSVVEYALTDVSKDKGLFHPGDDGTTILRNSGCYVPKDTA